MNWTEREAEIRERLSDAVQILEGYAKPFTKVYRAREQEGPNEATIHATDIAACLEEITRLTGALVDAKHYHTNENKDRLALQSRTKELEDRLAHVGKLAGAAAEHPGMTKSRLKLIREVCARR